MIVAALPLGVFTVSAETSGTCGDNLTWILDSEGTLTISGAGAMFDFESNGNGGATYAYNCFTPWQSLYNKIKKVVICDGVTSIGNYSFCGCRNLSDVSLPNTLTHIGRFAFMHCGSLKVFNMPNSVTSILDAVFYYSGIKKIKFSDNLVYIIGNTFAFCNIDEITLPKNLLYIDVGFLYGGTCKKVIYEGNNWAGISFGNSYSNPLQTAHCYYHNSERVSEIFVPDNSVIYNYAFMGYENLNLYIPPSVNSIGDKAFLNCKSLIIFGASNSYAETYARKNNIPFKSYINYSHTNNDLEYPIFDENSFANLLNLWTISSRYSSAFNNYINEGHTYNELLYKTIDIPVKGDDGNIYSVKGSTQVKDLMAYILFADKAQDYLIKSLNNTRSSFQKNKASDAYQDFFKCIKNFQSQYYCFQNNLNNNDDFQQTLYSLLIAKTILTVVDNSVTKNVKYAFDLYKGSVSESPQLYDNLYYYVMSGGDTSYLNSSYASTMNGLGVAVKDSKQVVKIVKDGFSSGDATSYVTLGLDNLSYFAEKYKWDYKDKIKKAKEAWEWADTAIEYANAITSFSFSGTLSASWKLSNAYIDEIKKIYTNAASTDAGWYALTYFYLMGNNKDLLNELIDQNTGSAEFGIDRIAQYGKPYNQNDIIENNIVKYWNKKAYLTYSYTPNKDMCFYLWKACGVANSIMEMDTNDYSDMLLQYLLAEINLQNGMVGINQNISVTANDSDLGGVSGSGQYLLGSSVTVSATPYTNVTFQGWKNTETNEVISTARQYTFEVNDELSLQAIFVAGNVETALTPNISMNSSNKSYYCGVEASSLNVLANSNDSGTISVKWYKNNTNRNYGGSYVGTGFTFTPDTSDVGTTYYYAIATNTLNYQIGTKTVTTDASSSSQTVKIEVLNPIVTSIDIYSFPAKQKYFKGRTIISEGMSLSAVFSNGNSEIISDGYSLQNCNTFDVGIKIITAYWLGKTVDFTVEIIEPNATHLTSAIRMLLNLNEEDSLYDINDDGSMDIIDLVILKKQLANISN